MLFPFVSFRLSEDQVKGTVPIVHGLHFQNEHGYSKVQPSPNSLQEGWPASVRVFARVFVSECNPASFPQVRLLLNREPGPWGWEGGLGDLINLISECP